MSPHWEIMLLFAKLATQVTLLLVNYVSIHHPVPAILYHQVYVANVMMVTIWIGHQDIPSPSVKAV
jgi:hypothetical protein